MTASYAAKHYRVNGIDLNVVVAGEGTPVLLVHGFPDTGAVWRKQIPVLVEAGYQVIVPDTRGCGDSDMPPDVSDYRLEQLVADMVGLLDELGIDKVRLVGHDWGAIICWRLVMDHPERIERYLAVSVGHPSCYVNGGLGQKLKGLYVVLFQALWFAEWLLRLGNFYMLRMLARFPEEFPQWHSQLSRPGRLTAGINYYRANFRLMMFNGDPRRVAVPVKGIWSTGDAFLTEKQMIESQHYVDGAWHYSRVEGANHWIQLDAPEKFNPLLLDYLQ